MARNSLKVEILGSNPSPGTYALLVQQTEQDTSRVKIRVQFLYGVLIPDSSNGRRTVSETENRGSSPRSGTNNIPSCKFIENHI